MIRLIRPLDRDAEIRRLFVAKCVEFDAELAEVEPGHFFVEFLDSV
jgi:hypothetical protein